MSRAAFLSACLLALDTGPFMKGTTGFMLSPVHMPSRAGQPASMFTSSQVAPARPIGRDIIHAGGRYSAISGLQMSTATADSAPPVRITYANAEEGENTLDFDLLVVACDPSALFGKVFQGMTPLESDIHENLKRFTFHTSLWQVDRSPMEEYAVRFAPDVLNKMEGDVYAFRDEVRAHQKPADDSGSTLVTCYQLTKDTQMTEQELQDRASTAINGQVDGYEWLGFKGGKLQQTVNTNYFPHFSQEGLTDGLPWKILQAQGENNTLYVSSFTCFESVLHCYQYGNMLGDNKKVQKRLKDVKASAKSPRVAVIGAGPSGLLFASQQLKKAGLKDVMFFENSDRYGGKTHTVLKETPGHSDQKVVCELGTCYLSAAYKKFANMLHDDYGVDRPFHLDGDDKKFRGVYDRARHSFVDWDHYYMPGKGKISEFIFYKAVACYVVAYYLHMGRGATPMPKSKPRLMPKGTVLEFLKSISADDLEHLFTYAYQVQGYGNIHTIPAYYGLIWMTPGVFLGTIDKLAADMERQADKKTVVKASGEPAEDDVQRAGSKPTMLPEASDLKKSASILRNSSKYARMIQSLVEGGTLVDDRTTPDGDDLIAYQDNRLQDMGRIYAMPQGWGQVWDKIVQKEGLERAIKFNTTVLTIERGGLVK